RWSFRVFNAGFNLATSAYTRAVGGLLRVSVFVLVIYGGLIGLTYISFTNTPTGFIPTQDKGYLLVNVELPDAASLGRTDAVMRRIEDIARFELEQVEAKPTPPDGVTWTVAQIEWNDQVWAQRCEQAAAEGLVVKDEAIFKKKKREGVAHTVAVSGQSLLLNA